MTRHNRPTDLITIQTWPNGTSYTYQGDPEREAITLWPRDWRDTDTPCRPATADEQRAIRVAVRAERYAERDVLYCMSALVGDLFNASAFLPSRSDLVQAFTPDNVTNLIPDPSDWDAATCRAWCEDQGVDQDVTDPPRVPCAVHVGQDNEDGVLSACPDCVIDDDDSDYLDELRNLIADHAEPAEVFEWWLVSSWLGGKLADLGVPVLDTDGYGVYWGRTTTGQAYIMDGVLQAVAAQFEAVPDAA